LVVVRIKYSVRDLLSDISDYAWPTKLTLTVCEAYRYTVNDVSASFVIRSTYYQASFRCRMMTKFI